MFTQNINIIATIFLLGIGFLYFFNHNNKLSYEQHQVFSYDIQNPYYQELALREYLLDYYHVYAEKFIPRVQKNFDKPVHGTISSDQFMQYFHKRFNNNIPIRFSEKIIPPREFVTASNIVNHKIKELYKSTDGTSIFYDDKLKTIGLRTNDSVLINKLSRLSIEVEGNIFLKQKKQKIDINAKRERKVYATFYDKNPQLFLIELPLWTETFTIQPLGVKINTQQAEIREKSTYNTEYGNIMR